MSTPVGIIKKFVKTLVDTESTGTAAVNEAFKAVGATSYSALQSAFNQARNSSSNNQNFLEQSCGVRINNTDAGTSTAKTAAQYNSFTKNGLKVNVTYHTVSDTDAGEAFGCSGATYLAKQRLVTRALYNRWISAAIWGLPRV